MITIVFESDKCQKMFMISFIITHLKAMCKQNARSMGFFRTYSNLMKFISLIAHAPSCALTTSRPYTVILQIITASTFIYCRLLSQLSLRSFAFCLTRLFGSMHLAVREVWRSCVVFAFVLNRFRAFSLRVLDFSIKFRSFVPNALALFLDFTIKKLAFQVTLK